uniref:Exosome complex component CSL4 C-terminal domain-containing protein n=1 Tax=Capra hircus TaxID=9925 RepID=A0A8C2PKG0_CAPHI
SKNGNCDFLLGVRTGNISPPAPLGGSRVPIRPCSLCSYSSFSARSLPDNSFSQIINLSVTSFLYSKEDVRATEKDKVEIYKSFRPGDIVLAKVISLGDAQSNYLLTTAENELGVVVAHSESGVQMVPISWCEMQCPKTHTKEFRKVARVQPEFLQT